MLESKDRAKITWRGSVVAVLGLVMVLLSALPASSSAAGCPNDAMRVGPSALLPDCRAYELVTPPNTNGRSVNAINAFALTSAYELFPTELASPSRDSILYMADASPLSTVGQANGIFDIYEAKRNVGAWDTVRRLGPNGEESSRTVPGGAAPDHSYSFIEVESLVGSLAGEGPISYLVNLDGAFELTGVGSLGSEPAAEGRYISEDGSHIIFTTGHLPSQSYNCWRTTGCAVRQLEEDAPGGGTGVVYDRSANGPTHVVSLLPHNVTPPEGVQAFYQGTSNDASSVAFTLNGTLYVRVHNGEPGEETEEVATGEPRFAGISDGGRYLFYVIGGDLGTIHRFDTTDEVDVVVNPGAEGEIVNVSADGSHVYFVSAAVLSGAEPNENGEAAVGSANGSGTLIAAKGTGTLVAGSATITGVSASEGTFQPGMEINGAGIPDGALIESVGSGTLILSTVATGAGSTDLTAGSRNVSGVSISEGEFMPGMAISGSGIQQGTTITAVGSGVLTLSRGATESGVKALTGTFPNLYAWSGGSLTFIARVAPSDLERTSGSEVTTYCAGETRCGSPALTRWTTDAVAPTQYPAERGPGADSSRTTSNGSVLVFESRAKLTSYDNAGHTEVYRYDDVLHGLTCVSCNIGKSAIGTARLQELILVPSPVVIHNLSDDGSRVFFETDEALSEGDTDGVNDIYEWRAEGSGGNAELISSGKSLEYESLLEKETGVRSPHVPRPNTLLSITPTGEDVVFLSQDALIAGAGEGGTPAIYDARVGGGFPQSSPPRICLEEECRGEESGFAPNLQGQASESASGAGNAKLHKHQCHRDRKIAHGRKGGRKRCKGHARQHRRQSPARASLAEGTTSSPSQSVQPGSGADPTSSQGAEDAAQATRSRFHSVTSEASSYTYGIESVEAAESTSSAGGHPDFRTNLKFNHYVNNVGSETTGEQHTEEISVSLPRGLLGSINATERCDTGRLVAFSNCPLDSQVGLVKGKAETLDRFNEPLYNLIPPHPKNEVARLGFTGALYPVFIDIHVRTAGDYGVTATVHSAPGLFPILRAETTLWGNPSDPVHDPQRLLATEGQCSTVCEDPAGKREVPRTGLAFMSNPSACQEGSVDFAVKSYQLPGQVFEKSAPLAPITDCTGLPFAPTFEAEPTSHVAGAPTGLKTKLVLPQHLQADEKATATMREARVTLPAGMQVAAGAANWIGTCSEEQVGYHEEVDAACPDNSKLGTATITSPAVSTPLEGTLYQRTPRPGHQLGLWLTSDALGLHIKIPGELEPDPSTGRLTAVFRDLPQVPVEEIDLSVWGGPRAPLQNPDHCGTFTTDYSFAPHSEDPAVTGQSQMQITEGCNQPFSPTLHAGVTEPTAGKYSPLVIDLAREDGQQALRGFELELPDGELAKIKGVPLCPDGAAASGSCPADSAIGHLAAASGPGPEPLWVPQPGKAEPKLYLAGPYQGSPFSVVTEVPAQAGPFDLGTVVVRSGLGLDPDTNRAVVKADPLPQFFEGVGLTYRRVHAVVDRPEFSLNPTDCSEMQVDSNVTSTQGTVAHPAARFQVDGCKALKFKPKLSLRLKGGTERGDYPALTAVLKARKGDANIARTSVGLPHSEFLAQEHIVTICTRKQFAADKCPKGSIYGRAKAWTPLLAKPLEGPVYLRSSSHPLPDMVVALGGELDVNLIGRIDSHNGGIRSTFESVPDAPVTKFVLKMRGGRKSLLVNSTDICRGKHRASVAMRGQNGRALSSRPAMTATGCGAH